MRDLMKELNNTIQSMNLSVRKIAKEINVSRTTISNGLDLKNWRNEIRRV
ncbi:hypothetical protein ACT7C1_24750 [Bacillus paranthracis]